MIEIIYLILVILIAYGLGKKILDFFRFKFDFLKQFLFSVTLGYIVFYFLTFIAGITGYLYPWLFYIILLVLVVILFKEIKDFIITLGSELGKIRPKLSLEWILTCILLLVVLFNLFASLAPPFFWDAVNYHLLLPKLYLQAHKIFYVPYISLFSEFPLTTEMLFLFGMLIKNDVLSQLINFSLSVLLIIAIYSFTKEHFNKLTALFAAVIFYTIPIVEEFTTVAYVEISFAFFSFMAFYAFIGWFKTKKLKFLILSAFLAGITAGIKPTAPISALIISVFVAYATITAFKKGSLKHAVRNIILFGLISFAVVSPWYIKSYVHTGNPVYPFLYSVFGGPNWSAEHAKVLDIANTDVGRWGYDNKANLYEAYTKSHGFDKWWLYLILLPWDITMHGNFTMVIGVSAIFLAFIPAYFMFRKRDLIINLLLVYSLFYIIFWFFWVSVIRYLVPMLPFLAIACAYVITRLLSDKFLNKKLLFILLVALIFNLVIWYGVNGKQMRYVFAGETEEEFYSKLSDEALFAGYKLFQYTNKNLPRDSRIFTFGISHGAYFSELDLVGGSPFTQAYVNYNKFENEDGLYKRLKEIGITHIVYYEFEGIEQELVRQTEYTPRIMGMVSRLLEKHATFVYETNRARLYKLN